MEYGNSEDEKDSNIIPNNNDDDEITSDFDNNSNLNNFEFEEIPDNYIEDKIYHNLKLKVKEFFKKEKSEFESLDKNMQDMVIKGQLMSFQKDENTRKVNEKHGIKECIYGNTGKAPKNINHIKVNYYIASDIFLFLKNYSNVYGMPSPEQHFNEISMPVVFLLTSFSYTSIYRDYIQAYKEKHEPEICVMVESTFVKIWKSLIPSLQFIFPKFDLCENCETMKMDIQYTTQHEKKLDLTENYLNHLKSA
ncbi:hypothetical protein C1646_756931 [Rhizophagus diaphanus]|nr:hypothetical protein C1646_756931 [Rhizophagus diaphanus] [Rhizophagus sp. MUCL 43196]